jgi:hypothetical protein
MTAENGGALRGPEPPSEDQATTNNNDRISRRREYPTPPPMPAENNSNEENESTRAEHHRRIERRHWTFEKIVAAVALIVTAAAMWGAIASAIYASRALIASQQAANEAARQADAAYSDQRPWLRVNLTLIGFRILENADSEITYHFEGPIQQRSATGRVLALKKPHEEFGSRVSFWPRVEFILDPLDLGVGHNREI